MSLTADPLVFLGMVAAISATGALMPGPVTAAAIAKGFDRKWAGLHIALGHALVEFPTIALIALGFSAVLRNVWVNIAIGLLGGAMLVFMGASMVLSRGGVVEKLRALRGDGKSGSPAEKAAPDPFPYHPVIAGVITTASNPYYFLWWATLGAALTLNALEFGLAVLVAFSVLHWSIDLGWDVFLAYTVNKGRDRWNDRAFVAVFAFCGGVMVIFGVWFGATAVVQLLT